MSREAENLISMGRIGTGRNYLTACHSFSRFQSAHRLGNIKLAALTAGLLAEYEAWMWNEGVSRNSTSNYMRSLRAVYKRHMGRQGDSQLFEYVYTGCASTSKRAITADDIHTIMQLDIAEGLRQTAAHTSGTTLKRRVECLELVRDYFVFCLTCRGLTFVDLAYLRHSDIAGDFLTYRRKKTGHEIRIFLEPIMKDIIQRRQTHTTCDGAFLFPIIETECSRLPPKCDSLPTHTRQYLAYRHAINFYNAKLKQLGRLVSPQLNLTSYVSRHTWATLAYRSEVPLPVISKAMGHSSVQTTQIYLQSFADNEIDLANRMLLGRYVCDVSNRLRAQ